MTIAVLEPQHPFSRDHLPFDLAHRCVVIVRMYEVEERFAQELLGAPSEHFSHRRTDALEVAICTGDTQEVERQGKETVELRLRTLTGVEVVGVIHWSVHRMRIT